MRPEVLPLWNEKRGRGCRCIGNWLLALLSRQIANAWCYCLEGRGLVRRRVWCGFNHDKSFQNTKMRWPFQKLWKEQLSWSMCGYIGIKYIIDNLWSTTLTYIIQAKIVMTVPNECSKIVLTKKKCICMSNKLSKTSKKIICPVTIKDMQTPLPPSILISLLWMMESVLYSMGKIIKQFSDFYF